MNKEVYVNIKISMPNGSDMSFSDEEIKEMQDYYEKEFSNFDYLVGEINVSFVDEKTKQINQLKQQLEESFTEEDVEGLIEDRDKTIKFLQNELAEKDKEIEKLKQQYTILENENGKLTTELIMDKYKKAQKEVSFGKQLAIQELEKVKTLIQNAINFEKPNFVEVYDAINKQIKELKGEKNDNY